MWHALSAHDSSWHAHFERAGICLYRHAQNAHATKRHAQNAHATKRHAQNAHATMRHAQNAHATKRHAQNAHATYLRMSNCLILMELNLLLQECGKNVENLWTNTLD
jgi:hypothetical protein